MNNLKKNNNGWILCPSKTFPGKFYYFNVLNGEAAWSLNDSEKKLMKKDSSIDKVNDKHTYPEPNSPPEESPNTSNFTLHGHTQYNMPMFGQATFPQYITNAKYPKIVTHMPTQTVVCEKKKDQFTQTWELDRELYVQSCGVPLSYRFVNHNKFNDNPFKFNVNSLKFNDNELKFNNHTLDFNKNKFEYNENTLKFHETPLKLSETLLKFSESPLKFNENTFKFNENKIKNVENPLKHKYPVKYNDNTFKINEHSLRFNETPSQYNKNPNYNKNQLKLKECLSKTNENLTLFNENKFINYTSTPINNTCLKNRFHNTKDLANNSRILFQPKIQHQLTPISNKVKYRNLNRNTSKSYDDLSIINEKSNNELNQHFSLAKSYDDLSTVDDFATSTTCYGNKIRNMLVREDCLGTKMKELDKCDLRYVLELRKKQKSVDHIHSGFIEGKKLKTQDTFEVGPKKHVSFDVIESSDEDTVLEDTDFDLSTCLNIAVLRNLAKPIMIQERWYIVVDTNILLEDYNFIENYVQTDDGCRLFIPCSVRHEIDILCRDTHNNVANRVANRIRIPQAYKKVQSSEKSEFKTTSEAILNCCLQINENNYHVILITNNPVLYKNAKSLGINSFTLEEIKHGIHEPENYSDLKKIKVIIQNENENIFLQPPNDYIPFSDIRKDYITVDTFKKRLFDKPEVKLLKDTGTSPIHMENLKSIPKIIRPNQKVPNYYESDGTDTTVELCNIKNLNLKEELYKKCSNDKNVKEIKQVKDLSMELNYSANCMKLNGFNFDDKLNMFFIKDQVMEERIGNRMDEWICVFTQLMEEVLSDVLQNYSSPVINNLSPPWSLHEAVECIKNMYGDHPSVKKVMDKFSILLYTCSKMDKLNNNMKPEELVKIIGCGTLLIQALKNVLPQSEELFEGDILLSNLIKSMSQEADCDTQVTTPILGIIEDKRSSDRINFIKKPSDILPYLKKHYPVWENCDEHELNKDFYSLLEKPKEVNILRTYGKDLFNLKIDNKKNMSINKNENILENEKIIEKSTTVNNSKSQLEIKPHDTYNEKDAPIVIRNIKLIDAFEERLKLKADYNNIEYNEMYESLSTITDNLSHQTVINDCADNNDYAITKINENERNCSTNINKNAENNDKYKCAQTNERNNTIININTENDYYICAQNNDNISLNNKYENNLNNNSDCAYNNDKINENGAVINDKNELIINKCSVIEEIDLTNDSGFENDSLHTYALAKTFLTELSCSFKAIYSFIDSSINEYKFDDLQEDKRKQFQEKASRTQIHITDIIDKLKSIVERESSEGATLKILLINAGVEAATDKRMIRYRQVVMKCLEQAQMLQGALKTMLNVSYEDTEDTANVRYFNIYE